MTVAIEKYFDPHVFSTTQRYATITVHTHSSMDFWLDENAKYCGIVRQTSPRPRPGYIAHGVTKQELKAFIDEFYLKKTVSQKPTVVNTCECSNTKTYECRYVPHGQMANHFAVYNEELCLGWVNASGLATSDLIPNIVSLAVRKIFMSLQFEENFCVTVPQDITKPMFVYKAQHKKTGVFYYSRSRNTWTRL